MKTTAPTAIITRKGNRFEAHDADGRRLGHNFDDCVLAVALVHEYDVTLPTGETFADRDGKIVRLS